MVPGPLYWILGALLFVGGMLASLYILWVQVHRGVTGFTMLATSDALATVAIAITFFLNAAHMHNETERVFEASNQCNPVQLALASALFLGPFVNTFMSMVVHTAESSCNTQVESNVPRRWKLGISPRLAYSMAAQWLVPIISSILLLTANVQHSRSQLDSDTCSSGAVMVPISVEIMEQCLHQGEISNYITTLMNNINYSSIHDNAAMDMYRLETLNKSEVISNKTSMIVNKIYDILLGSLKTLNQSEQIKQHNFPLFSNASKLWNNKLINESKNTMQESSASGYENYYNTNNNATYYSKSKNFHRYKRQSENIDADYSHDEEDLNYDSSDTDNKTKMSTNVVLTSTVTSQQELNNEEEETTANPSFVYTSSSGQQEQQSEEEGTSTVETMVPTLTTLSHVDTSSLFPILPQTETNTPPVEFNSSPSPTPQSLTTKSEDILESLNTEESSLPLTSHQEYGSSKPTATETNDAHSQEPTNADVSGTQQQTTEATELTTTENEDTFQLQTNPSTTHNEDSWTSTLLETTTEALTTTNMESTTHAEDNLIHVQVPETMNLCITKCYFSDSFLKKYLFVLLFLCYFVPIVVSMVMYVTTDKNLTMMKTAEVEPNDQTSSSKITDEEATKIAGNMHLARMVLASKTTKQHIITSILFWTPTFLETLLRVWFCINTPEWLTTLLFVLGQAQNMVRNFLNVRVVKHHACNGTIQPFEVQQDKVNQDIPTKLFTKVKATFLN